MTTATSTAVRVGPVTIGGVPLPDAMVEQLRAAASVEPLLVDDDGFPVAVQKRTSSLSTKIIRSVLLRDGHCRCGECDLRFGLQVHHLRPRTWGGSDEISNLAAVAGRHHRMLVPNGPYALVGNPNLPDGVQMVCTSTTSVPSRRGRSACPGREPDLRTGEGASAQPERSRSTHPRYDPARRAEAEET